MGIRTESVCRTWGAVEFRSATEEIGEPTEWALWSDRHTLKVLRSGEIPSYAGRIDGERTGPCALTTGNVGLVPAGRDYRSSGWGTRIAFSVVSFPDPGEATPFLVHRDEFIYQTVVRMDEALASGDEILGETLGLGLLLHVRGRYFGPPPSKAALSTRQRRRLDEYIEANLGDRPTVSTLARELGMGRSRFTVAFRNAYETTPARHLLNRRLSKARLRLEAASCDLTELALELGFASHSHLTTTFKSRYGLAPRDVRASAHLAPSEP